MVAAFGTIFGAGASLITDRQIGNLKLFLMTPISSTSLILGKAIYGTTTAMIYAALAILIAFMLGATVAQGVVGIIFILLITLVLSFGLSSLALVLASKIKKFEMYTILGNVMVLPLWFLSGAFFPSSSMPTWMQYISAADPLTYAVNGIRGFMLTTYYPVTSILIDFALLAVFAIVMFTLAVKLFKNKIG
jgi:ABC-2 type transport system permease protein